MKKNYTTVLFDVDGTLVDLRAIVLCLQLTLKKYGLRVMKSQEIKEHFIGFSFQEVFPKLYPEARSIHKKFYADFLSLYLKDHKRYSEPFPDVKETLEKLRKHRIKIGIVTTKSRAGAMKILRDHGIKYDVLVAYDDVKKRKPDPSSVRKAMKKLGAKPGETIFVGDHRFDIVAGNLAGCTSVGVTIGAGTRQEFERAKADHIITNIKEVLHIAGL